MSDEQCLTYQQLLQEFREQCLHLTKGDINSRQRLMSQIEQLVFHEPKFKALFDAMIQENLEFLPNLKIADRVSHEDLLEELEAFAHGKSVNFTDRNLQHLINWYEKYSDLKKICDTDPSVLSRFG